MHNLCCALEEEKALRLGYTHTFRSLVFLYETDTKPKAEKIQYEDRWQK